MHKLEIQRTTGNIPKSLAGEDHVTGIIFYVTGSSEMPAGFKQEHVHAVSTIDKAEELGITADSSNWEVQVLHYHLSELFRVNPAVSLYVGVFAKPTDGEEWQFEEIKTVQNYAGGRIRQMGVWGGVRTYNPEKDMPLYADITNIQTVAEKLDRENAPLSVIYAPYVDSITDLPTDIARSGRMRVSVLIGQDGSGTGWELNKVGFVAEGIGQVSCLGVVLGLLSRAKVHQSVSWVKDFATGISVPAFVDGTLYRSLDSALVEQLDAARYMFLTTYPAVSGSYINDSHTMDVSTGDYAMIESVRTMDKAVRGVRTYLTPELGGNVYIDASTGKLQAFSVAHLETTANKALEDMEKAGELSGYKVEIDPEQDVLSTSTVEIVIKQVPVGVMRKINVKIGFTKSV